VDYGYVVDILVVAQNPYSMITGRNASSFDDILMPLTSTVAWVDKFLNLTNGYYKVTSSEDDQFEYFVPFPLGYTNTMGLQMSSSLIRLVVGRMRRQPELLTRLGM
jgi:hypothetical protein